MKKCLKQTVYRTYYYVDGIRKEGIHDRISGDVTGISGDVDDAKITKKERQKGINISELIAQDMEKE